MNPPSMKCAQRVFLTLAAATGLLLLAACGSNSPAPINNNGFNASFLNGTYVFSTEGTDAANGTLIALAGAFTANGSTSSPTITGGTMDVIDPAVGVGSALAISSGSYNVSSDGRGKASLATSAGTFILDFVLTTSANGVSSHGLVIEYDTIGSGSGTLDLQVPVPDQAGLAGPYAFSLAGAGASPSFEPFASAGAFTLSSGGTSTAGVEDFNRDGTPLLNNSLSVSAISGSGATTPGTATFASAYNQTFDFYPIDSTHWKAIETDGNYFLAGDIYSQAGATTIPTGPLVFTVGGVTASGGIIAAGGLIGNSDGQGNFSGGLEDVNINGNPIASLPFTGTAGAAPGTGGRVQVGLSGFNPSVLWVVYPSSGGLLIMAADISGVITGAAFPQTATAFTVPAGYGLNLTGANASPSAVDIIAQFNATAAATNNMSGVIDENDQGTVQQPVSISSGGYAPDSPATGRGNIAVNANTTIGGFTLEYYTIDANDAIFIDVDTTQVGVGSFEAQTGVSEAANASAAKSSNAAAAHRLEGVVHPFTHSKLTKKTK